MSRLPEVIETPRLLLRLPVGADAAALNRAIDRSHTELAHWMEWAVRPQSLEETETFCRSSLEQWQAESACNLLMVERDGGGVVGGTGYPRVSWSVPAFEIGYWCRTDRVGRGYVSEAVWALTRHAFENLAAGRVEIRMDDDNQRSWRVAERLGFSREGVLRNEARTPDGALRDTRIYAAISLAELSPPDPFGVSRPGS